MRGKKPGASAGQVSRRPQNAIWRVYYRGGMDGVRKIMQGLHEREIAGLETHRKKQVEESRQYWHIVLSL